MKINGGCCSVLGCEKKAKVTGLCSMHYTRKWRYGSVYRTRSRKKSYTHTGGYIVEHMPGHSLSNSSDEVYQHRRVFYDAHGDGPFNCHCCGNLLTWETLDIDHLDDSTDNNDIDNLRPACPTCNIARGAWKLKALYLEKYGYEYEGKRRTVEELSKIAGLTRQGMRKRILKMGIDAAMKHKKHHRKLDSDLERHSDMIRDEEADRALMFDKKE